MSAELKPEGVTEIPDIGGWNDFRDDLDCVSGERTDDAHKAVTTSWQAEIYRIVAFPRLNMNSTHLCGTKCTENDERKNKPNRTHHD